MKCTMSPLCARIASTSGAFSKPKTYELKIKVSPFLLLFGGLSVARYSRF